MWLEAPAILAQGEFTGPFALLADAAIKGTALLVGVGLVAGLLRRASAAARHLLWLGGLGALLCLPLASLLLPPWSVLPGWLDVRSLALDSGGSASTLTVTVPSPERAQDSMNRPKVSADPVPAAEKSAAKADLATEPLPSPSTAPYGSTAPPQRAWLWGNGLLLAWGMGATLSLIHLAAGWIGLRRLRRLARRATDVAWRKLLRECQQQAGYRRPVQLLIGAGRRVPLAWGWRSPCLLLPEDAEDWSRAERRWVLLHELAHLQRGDGATAPLARIVCALYWFHPLVWWAADRLCLEQECACDDRVLHAGAEPADYARQVLRAAAGASRRAEPQAPAIAMARRGDLEARLTAILETGRNRRPLLRRTVLAALVAAGAIVGPLAMLRGAQPAPEIAAAAPRSRTAASPETSTLPVAPGLELSFPADRPLGTLYLQDASSLQISSVFIEETPPAPWEYWRPAQGRVTMPAGKRLRLAVRSPDAFKDLSPLAGLAPEALTELAIVESDASANPDRTVLPHLRGLRGLQVLTLRLPTLTPEGLAHLRELRSLRRLSVATHAPPRKPGDPPPRPQLDDACVEALVGLSALESLCLEGHGITDAGLAHLSHFPALESLEVTSPGIQGAGLTALGRLPALRRLRLAGVQIADSAFERLAGCRSLRSLALRYQRITDAGGWTHWQSLPGLEELTLWGVAAKTGNLARLSALPNLRHLDLAPAEDLPTAAVEAAAEALGALNSLERLRLAGFALSDRALKPLTRLRRLRELDLGFWADLEPRTNGVYLSDRGVAALAELTRLEHLALGSPLIGGPGVAALSRLPGLTRLELTAGELDNEGLRSFGALTSLRSLELNAPQATISGLNALTSLSRLERLCLRSIRQDNRGLDLSGLVGLREFNLVMRRYLENGIWPREDEAHDNDMAWVASVRGLRALGELRGLSDVGLSKVASLTELRQLAIGGPDVSDAGLVFLSRLTQLEYLALKGRLNGDGLRCLEGLPRLRALYLVSLLNLDRASLDRLRRALPNLEIYYDRLPLGGGG